MKEAIKLLIPLGRLAGIGNRASLHLLVELGKGVFALFCRPDVAALVLVALHPVLQRQGVCPGRVLEGLPPPRHLSQSAHLSSHAMAPTPTSSATSDSC